MGQQEGRIERDAGRFRSRSALSIVYTTHANDPVFDAFYREYDLAFVIAAEKETRAGFAACMALNHGARYADLSRRYGPFAEIVLVAHDPETGALAGGANFFAARFAGPDGAPVVTANLNYIYTPAAQRGRGYFRRLYEAMRELIVALLPVDDPRAPLVFAEQNDPFRATPESDAEDRRSGMNPFTRLAIWSHLGARLLDFDYVQPSLDAGQPDYDGLVYCIIAPETTAIDSLLLAAHLERFFALSVLKGNPAPNAAAEAQLAALKERARKGETVAALDGTALFTRYGKVEPPPEGPERPSSIVAAIRQAAGPD